MPYHGTQGQPARNHEPAETPPLSLPVLELPDPRKPARSAHKPGLSGLRCIAIFELLFCFLLVEVSASLITP